MTKAQASKPRNWLRLNELTNAIDNLKMCGRFLCTLPDPIRWKWAILALHQAVYGFAICAVKGTQDTSVLEAPAKSKRPRLIPIWEALKRAEDVNYLWSGAFPLRLSSNERKALEKLFAEFRNGFEHFQPAAWSIEVSGMPNLFRRALPVLRRLALEQRSVQYYDEADERRAEAALKVLDAILAPGSAILSGSR